MDSSAAYGRIAQAAQQQPQPQSQPQPQRQPQNDDVPKDDSSSTTPPPAYTPRGGLQDFAQRHLAASRIIMGRNPLAVLFDNAAVNNSSSSNDDDDDDEDPEGFSPICLRINTAVTVTSNHNIVCLADTPANHAKAIGKALVQALHESSSGRCGIPMIDEEGRPRPIKIEVDAGITVEGAHNVVGNEALIKVACERMPRRRRRMSDEEEEQEEEEQQQQQQQQQQGEANGGPPSKRRCTEGTRSNSGGGGSH